MNLVKVTKIAKAAELIGALIGLICGLIVVFQLIGATTSISGAIAAAQNVPGMAVFARVGVFIMFFGAIAAAVLSGMSKQKMVGSIIGCILALIAFICNFMLNTISSLENLAIAGYTGNYDPGAIVFSLFAIIVISLIVAIMSIVGIAKKSDISMVSNQAYIPNQGYPQNVNQQFTPNQAYPQNANQQFNPNQAYPQNDNSQNPAGGFYQNNGKM